MASSSELASAAGRRAIGNIAVPPQTWGGFDGAVSSGQWAGFDPVDCDRDLGDLFKAGTEGDAPERLWDYMGFGPFANDADMQTWLAGCMTSTDPIFVGFRDQATGRLGGMGSFMEIRPNAGVVELGNLWFGRAWQRDRRATEVLSLMMHHAMETLGYRRLEWKCNAFNAPSRSAALRLGFRYEGEFLNHLIVKGRSRDTAWFSITDEEWPGVRDAHARWFAPGNFDADGQQRESLSDLSKALW
ncbi:MAG: GNAT family protein [Proteobacteria bacterium]|nr:GNAT family protein [Pseudomonadota bacterium]MDA1308028.1 GNAT family protein [Pseudomonadota bacterium]